MNSITFFLFFIPILAIILLAINLIFAPHSPYTEKSSTFECGFHSFLGQNRTQFSVSFFTYGILFLLFDLELVLMYPLITSFYLNGGYGLFIGLVFFMALTAGLVFEIARKALNIDSRQYDPTNVLLSRISWLSKIKLNKFINTNENAVDSKRDVIVKTLKNYKLHINIFYTIISAHFMLFMLFMFNKSLGQLIVEYLSLKHLIDNIPLETLIYTIIASILIATVITIIVIYIKGINFLLEKITIVFIRVPVRTAIFGFFSTIYYCIFDIDIFMFPLLTLMLMVELSTEFFSNIVILNNLKNNIYIIYKSLLKIINRISYNRFIILVLKKMPGSGLRKLLGTGSGIIPSIGSPTGGAAGGGGETVISPTGVQGSPKPSINTEERAAISKQWKGIAKNRQSWLYGRYMAEYKADPNKWKPYNLPKNATEEQKLIQKRTSSIRSRVRGDYANDDMPFNPNEAILKMRYDNIEFMDGELYAMTKRISIDSDIELARRQELEYIRSQLKILVDRRLNKEIPEIENKLNTYSATKDNFPEATRITPNSRNCEYPLGRLLDPSKEFKTGAPRQLEEHEKNLEDRNKSD